MKKMVSSLAILASVVLAVPSLVGFSSEKPLPEAHPPIHIHKGASAAYQSGYTPSQIKKAYGLDQLSATGAGQTIAIVDAYGSPTITGDLQTFNEQFGLPQADLTITYPSGKPHRTDGGWALETALDVEWVHALAPQAKLLLVVAQSASLTDLVKAVDYASAQGAQVVSNSWGGSEFSSEAEYDSHFQHPGVVYVASSGDNGAGVSWPASSPSVLSVGGTTLHLDSNGQYAGEEAWSGSGGGTSTYEPRPDYENLWLGVVGSHRGSPDVSWDADPSTGAAVYSSIKYNGQNGWYQVGGTSFGAPCWAAMIALADQERKSPLSSYSTIDELYRIAGSTDSSGYISNYHDIREGNNGMYSAQAGYDLTSGIGTPKAALLLSKLIGSPTKH